MNRERLESLAETPLFVPHGSTVRDLAEALLRVLDLADRWHKVGGPYAREVSRELRQAVEGEK